MRKHGFMCERFDDDDSELTGFGDGWMKPTEHLFPLGAKVPSGPEAHEPSFFSSVNSTRIGEETLIAWREGRNTGAGSAFARGTQNEVNGMPGGHIEMVSKSEVTGSLYAERAEITIACHLYKYISFAKALTEK